MKYLSIMVNLVSHQEDTWNMENNNASILLGVIDIYLDL
jgi:hypothetical protein